MIRLSGARIANGWHCPNPVTMEKFKAKIAARAMVQSAGPAGLVYTSSTGKNLKLPSMPSGTCAMDDGAAINPAGILPKAWRDGEPVDYDSWDSYRAMPGGPLITK